MKRIIALLTVMMMLLSCVAVSATENVVEEFWNVMMNNRITEGSLDMNAKISFDMPILDTNPEAAVVKSLLNSSVDYKLNFKGNEAETVVKADGNMMFNSGAEAYGIPSFGMDMWLNLDIENLDNIQYFVILKAAGESFQQLVGDKYLLMDFAKIPGFKEIIKQLADLGLLNREKIEAIAEDIIDEEQLRAFMERLFEGVDFNMVHEGGKYSIVLGDAQIKQLYKNLFINLFEILAEIDPENYPAEEIEELKMIAAPIENIQIFDPVRGMVIEISDDARVMHEEVNIVTNIADILSVMSPHDGGMAGMDRSMMGLRLSLIADAVINNLPAGYEVQYPALNSDNSIDLFATQYGSEITFEMIEAAEKSENVIEIIYDGQVVELENKPMIINDRTFVPFRRLANMLGIDDENIGYDEATQKVYLKSEGIEIEMYIGSSVVYVNGEMKMLDVPAFTCNDRTYIPVRFVSEMFGKTVGYSEENGVQKITIDK